ncbi:TIGR01906 family membrane protein [Anaeromicropila herbilytica]|uniref:TIGR01906 family membrane protein n=1 Tax=Anaeromicropila herbilytica TaxID=2785025 RepID=UPI00232A639A|nr:TIGR01906 family membrane protein [Anaeromicropila herbilytica]
MRTHRKISPSNILIGIIFTIFFMSLGVILVVNFRPLYYLDINLLHIDQNSGISQTQIRENYDALIDYNSPFFHGDLEFPTLPSSPHGIQHFKEVKNIFVSFYYIAPITLIVIIVIGLYKKKRKDYSYLLTSSITMIILPLIVGIGTALNFDRLFIAFHKLFFRNNYWLFDPELDPIINLLPDTFFMHCAILIALIIVIGSASLYFIWRRLRTHSKYR